MDGGTPVPSIDELLAACSALFGGQVMFSIHFLRSIRPKGLRDAYRRRLMDVHPDRAEILGCPEGELHRTTVAVKEAYILLCRSLRNGRLALPPPSPPAPRSPVPRPPANSSTQPLYYEGPVPKRALRLGEYLYYRGVIPWQALITALCTQRRQRPVLGELAVRLRFLTREQVAQVRRRQSLSERFGEAAVRLGLLARGQLCVLLGRQRTLGYPLGHYIARAGGVSDVRIRALVEEHERHVRRHGRR